MKSSLVAQGILSGIKEGQIAIDMSTVLPATSLREQEAYAKRGVDFLDAPVFGSKQESAEAKLWILAAGNKAIFRKSETSLGSSWGKPFITSAKTEMPRR